MPPKPTTPISRVWPKVDKSGDCWPFQGAKNSRGYGHLGGPGGTTVYAHRVVYEATYGPVPDGCVVCHTCDNPPCCNPAHLFLGTQTTNLEDMTRKGRRRYRSHPGELNNTTKLTEAQVIEIRARAVDGEKQSALAVAYGVGKPAISKIVARQNWKHI